MPTTVCKVRCCVCSTTFDWHRRCAEVGGCCCDSECGREFEWRYKLSVEGKPYRPRGSEETAKKEARGKETGSVET
jgi:hypothetical protein